jgi:uncharacterized protein
MTPSHESLSFFLKGSVGRLESILWTPVTNTPPRIVAVVCHPHPLFGGTMHNKVVYQAAKSLDHLRIPALRFNFRGAGLSEGAHDRGNGELDDVRAALDFLDAEFEGAPILVAGFSFGCWVGSRVGCSDQRVKQLICLGTPVNNTDFSFLGDCVRPKLFVHGANDEHGDVKKLESLVAELPGEKSLVIVPGADHFFAGKLDQLDAAITNWLAARGYA